MSPIPLVLLVSLAVSAAVDPNSARARARRHEAALASAEAALAAGDASAALAAVLSVDERDRRLDWRRLRQVRARARLGVGDAAAAREDLLVLLSDPPPSTAAVDDVRRRLAEAERALGDFDACADALGVLAAPADDDRLARATCLRGTARRAEAHDVLVAGTSPAVRRLRAHLWLEDGLPRQARSDALAVADDLPPPEMLAWARAFHAGGDPATALVLADGVLARTDLDVETARGAARLLAAGGGRARVLRASLADPRLAEARRDVGDVAGAWRASVGLEGAARWRQRAALLVDAGAWERLWGLWPRLQAAGLGHDDEVAYAVAFAAFATDRLADAEVILDGVGGPATFARATALRAEIKRRQACGAGATSEVTCTR